MKKIKNLFLITILFTAFSLNAQICDYNLDNYSHNNCFGDSTGVIDITLLNPDPLATTFWWTGAEGFYSTSTNISNLKAGNYVIHIRNNVPGDTSTVLCYETDTIVIQESLDIEVIFELYNMCNENDSADVITNIWGGTPPYTTLWNTGDTLRNTDSLAPSILPYELYITDANSCLKIEYLSIPVVSAMNPFMSSVGVICKDDNTGSARVFVTKGTPPFSFVWEKDSSIEQYNDIYAPVDSFSLINNLSPGVYTVEITDDMGCIINDSIEVKSNPAICITVYKAFSPNDDDIHEFWEIENIDLYNEALVQVYDRTGRQVYNRRNYKNAEEVAFSGKDQEGRILPSGTYYYIIDLENGDTVFKGVLTMVR